MFLLSTLKNPGEPYPRTTVHASIDDLILIGITGDELIDGVVHGRLIRERYLIDFAPTFLNNLETEYLTNGELERVRYNQDRKTRSSLTATIAGKLDTTPENVRQILHRALKRLRDSGQWKRFQSLLTELYRLRSKRGIEIEIDVDVEVVE